MQIRTLPMFLSLKISSPSQLLWAEFPSQLCFGTGQLTVGLSVPCSLTTSPGLQAYPPSHGCRHPGG